MLKEDRQRPREMKATIESAFQPVHNTALYQEVFEIAPSCCILTRHSSLTNALRITVVNTEEKNNHMNRMDIIFWDQSQLRLMESLSNVMYIEGIAGSGKTLIMLEKARQLLTRNLDDKVLILCYNERLEALIKRVICGWIGDKLLSWHDRTRISTFHVNMFLEKLTSMSAHRAGPLPLIPRSREHYLVFKLENLPGDWIRTFSNMFQHVLIDEYQDFSESKPFLEALFLKKLLQGQGRGTFWVFYDNEQSGMHGVRFGRARVQVGEQSSRKRHKTK